MVETVERTLAVVEVGLDGLAIPHLEEAAAAMAAAGASLASEDLVLATQEESRSIEALFRAIERFAGTRQLIELAHGEQTRVVTLVTPPREIEGQIGEALAEMSTEDRLAAVREGVTRNRDRLTRLKELLQEELRLSEMPRPIQPGHTIHPLVKRSKM